MRQETDVLAGLDPQQRAAVLHDDGPGLIVAGAGSGKTKTLVHRIARLVADGVDPTTIMTLSFTRASAASVLQRARAFDRRAADVVGGTFHSVGARLVRENHAVFGLPPQFTILDPSDAEDLFRRLMAERPTSRMAPRASVVAKVVSFARNTRREIGDVLQMHQYDKHRHLDDWMEDVAQAYKDEKRRMAILDYDDLLDFWGRMAEDARLGPLLRARFRHLKVDEHQDSNAAQLRILYGMAGDDGKGLDSVMGVGDHSQSIYAFRGASPGTMFEFRERWPSTAIYLIESNYRSASEIVGLADAVDRSILQRFDRTLRAHRPASGDVPRIVHVQDADAERDFVVGSIIDRREEGVELKDQAIVVRSMRRARHIEIGLNAAGIPYRVMGGIKIHEAEHVKDLIAILKIVENPQDETAIVRFLKLFPKIGDKTALRIAQDSAGEDLASVLEAISQAALKKTSLAVASKVLAAVAAHADAWTAMRTAKDLMAPTLADKFGDEWEWREKDIDAIVDIAATQGEVGEFLQTVTIDVSVDKRAGGGYGAPEDEEPLTICTIHSAKGLEWRTVYIPSFTAGHMPSMFAETPEDMDEERRLFYVAVTRAKDELVFVKPVTAFVKGSYMTSSPSEFEQVVARHVHRENSGRAAPGRSFSVSSLKGYSIDGWG